MQTSRGKFDNLLRTTAESTYLVLDGYGLREQPDARPTRPASNPVRVPRPTLLLPTAFRDHLAVTGISPCGLLILHLRQVG